MKQVLIDRLSLKNDFLKNCLVIYIHKNILK